MTGNGRSCPPGGKRPRKAAAAIHALIACATIDEAAHRVGVSERTLRRWLHEADFTAALRDAQRERFEDALTSLRIGLSDAVETLRKALTDDSGAVRVRAAKALGELGLRAVVLDHEQRLGPKATVDLSAMFTRTASVPPPTQDRREARKIARQALARGLLRFKQRLQADGAIPATGTRPLEPEGPETGRELAAEAP